MNKYLYTKMMATPPSQEYMEVFLDKVDKDFLKRNLITYSPIANDKYRVSNIELRALLTA